jgi:phosphinothricin acetyltransferase
MSERQNVTVSDMTKADWSAVRNVYLEGIATGNATFETEAPTWEEWDADHVLTPRLVARTSDNTIIGWTALSQVSSRDVYAGVAEVSIYVAAASRGMGVGRLLMQTIAERSEEEGFWTLQAGVFPENLSSIQMHKRCGFRIVGVRERLGKLDGVWRDILLMERRSDRVGMD